MQNRASDEKRRFDCVSVPTPFVIISLSKEMQNKGGRRKN